VADGRRHNISASSKNLCTAACTRALDTARRGVAGAEGEPTTRSVGGDFWLSKTKCPERCEKPKWGVRCVGHCLDCGGWALLCGEGTSSLVRRESRNILAYGRCLFLFPIRVLVFVSLGCGGRLLGRTAPANDPTTDGEEGRFMGIVGPRGQGSGALRGARELIGFARRTSGIFSPRAAPSRALFRKGCAPFSQA